MNSNNIATSGIDELYKQLVLVRLIATVIHDLQTGNSIPV